MKNFTQWLETNNNIRIVSYNKAGEITFDINGKKYTYVMDAMYFYNKGIFRSSMRYAPGRALNLAKKLGQLVSINYKPVISMTDKNDEFEGACPNCGAHADSYQSGVVSCPNCGYSPD
jgi:hypothetical protein